jgi:aerobic carbon-monoxide dehydrogenase medium subunit
MFTRPFQFERAGRLADACELLRQHGEGAKVIAGGQSLLPLVNLGLAEPEVVIDISRADAGRDVSVADGFVTVGALVTHARLAADPLAASAQPMLGAAARKIGNARVRARGTLGGSLAHSDPAAELPLVMVALGASYEITDGRASREVKAEEFHVGFLSSVLAADELVAAARVPALGPGWGWSFLEVSRRDGDFALAAAAAAIRVAGGVVVESRVAVGGVSDRPVRLADVEISLSGAAVSEIGDRISGLGPIRGIRPISDTGASAGYRAHLCRVLVARALAEACGRSEQAGEAA